MSYFLQNLIDRHQEDGVSREVSRKVQPRPKAKFETDSGLGSFAQNDLGNSYDFTQVTSSDSNTGSFLARYNPDAKPTTTDASKQTSRNTQVPTQHNLDNAAIQPDPSQCIDDLKERIEALTFKLGQRSPVREIPISATENKSHQQNSPELPESAEQSKSQNLSITGELNQRIQTILHSLNSQQPQRTDFQREVESWREPPLSDTGNNIPTGPVQLPLMPETTSDFAQPAAKLKKQSMESQSEQRESHQSGLLQIPNWLTEMQADLNNRWQEMNTQAESEPVVNVTIGRVEVRAVQTETAKQPKPKQKPKGVMSLDDYLKQREDRERA